MKCTKAQELFSSYLENTIEASLRVEFEQHINECETCKKEYGLLQKTVMMLEELPEVNVPHDFHADVMARVEQSRRQSPRRVKWWEMNWQQVFTIRVPAKALAAGLAAVLLATLAVQLTPRDSVVAGWLPWSVKSSNVVNVSDHDAPAPWKPWGTDSSSYKAVSKGLSLYVGINSLSNEQSVYDLRIQTNTNSDVDYSVCMMKNDGTENGIVSSETVTRGQSRMVPIVVARSENEKSSVAAKVEWTYNNKQYSEYVFLPSSFDSNASSKSFSTSFNQNRMYDVLKQLSAEYGAIVLASGDLDKQVGNFNLNNATLDQALFQSAAQTGMSRHELAASTYVVCP